MFKFIALSIVYLGTANIYIGEDFQKVTEQVVERKSDQNKIGKSIASYGKEQKKFEKSLDKQLKELDERSSEESFSAKELAVFIQGVTNMHSEFIKTSIDKQLDIKLLYGDRQWNLLIKHYLKQKKTFSDARTHREELFSDQVDELKEVFTNVVKDTSRLDKALILLDSGLATTLKLYTSSVDIGFIESKVLSSRISAKRDVESVYAVWLANRKEFDKSFIGVIEGLSKIIKKEEWTVIRGQIGALY